MKIKLKLTLDNVNDLCKICDTAHFDVNVIVGRLCVDGCSVMGLMGLLGRDIELHPVTSEPLEIAEFYERVKELGAYWEDK